MKHKVLWIILIFFGKLGLSAQVPQQMKPWMGVAIEDRENAVGIRDTMPGTPAERAGFLPGDLIRKIDGNIILDSKQLISTIQSKGVGNEVTVEFERKSKTQSLTLKLEARPDDLELVRKKLVGKKVPKFNIEKLQKGVFSEKELENKVTVLEFWATWCPACVGSHKRLSAFSTENPSIQVLAVSSEEPDTLQKYNNLVLPKFTILRDNKNELHKHFMVSAIPMTVVLDGEGTVQFVTLGSGSYLEEALNFSLNLQKSLKK